MYICMYVYVLYIILVNFDRINFMINCLQVGVLYLVVLPCQAVRTVIRVVAIATPPLLALITVT